MPCAGLSEDHCCYLGRAGACHFLVENTAGRRWACSLMLEHGDWALVHADPRYVETVKPHWESSGTADCGDWPPPGKTCAVCGEVG